MSRIYMYPKNDYATLESPNPYVLHVEDSLSERHIIVNTKPNYRGVVELFFYLFKADIFFFNWIEDVSVKRYGKLQAVLFPVFLFLSKLFGKKVVWVLHNKYSHEKKNKKWTRFGFELMIKHSDLILTHSNAGVEFIKESFPRYASKVRYIIHPVEKMIISEKTDQKKNDLLIWGTIHPYKGVIDFLKFASQSPEFKNIKIIISGICPDKDEKKVLSGLLNENIVHIDEFAEMQRIAALVSISRFVLFTYNSDSILSSGSLMDSIRMGSVVIGPDKGSFRDLKSHSFIKTFSKFEDIATIVNDTRPDDGKCFSEIEDFCRENSWSSFGDKLFRVSDGML